MARTEVFDGLLMSELFDFTEIYPGDKTAHFEKIKEDSGVPFEQVFAILFHIHIFTFTYNFTAVLISIQYFVCNFVCTPSFEALCVLQRAVLLLCASTMRKRTAAVVHSAAASSTAVCHKTRVQALCANETACISSAAIS
jgi:hypothetical protein